MSRARCPGFGLLDRLNRSYTAEVACETLPRRRATAARRGGNRTGGSAALHAERVAQWWWDRDCCNVYCREHLGKGQAVPQRWLRQPLGSYGVLLLNVAATGSYAVCLQCTLANSILHCTRFTSTDWMCTLQKCGRASSTSSRHPCRFHSGSAYAGTRFVDIVLDNGCVVMTGRAGVLCTNVFVLAHFRRRS